MSCGDRGSDCETPLETLEVNGGREEHEEIEKVVSDLGLKDLETCSSSGAGVFGDLPPQALKYIQQLQSELTNMTEVSILLFFFFSSNFLWLSL
jgi:hypothetical protein